MLIHYLKTAFRNLYRNKMYSSINILGLAIGISAALLLAKYVGFNLAYDNFHQHQERIVLVHQKEYNNGLTAAEQPYTYWGVGKMATELYPEVVTATHFTANAEMLMIHTRGDGQSISFNENRICTVDTSFFSVFTFPAIAGDPETALSAPNAIVVTKSMARKYFGDRNPIGQVLTTRTSWGAEASYKVTCVLPDVPVNSTLRFDFLISAGLGPPVEVYWRESAYPTYLLMRDDTDPDALALKMSRDIGKHPVLQSEARHLDFRLTRLSDISLKSNDSVLAMTGVFILIISWINFINLSTGRAQSRSKETGVRKVVGATRRQVVLQFTLECILINGIALLLSVLVFVTARPLLLSFTGNKVLPLFNDPTPINLIFGLTFIGGTLASSAYPAIVMSSLNPISSLKGKFTHGKYSLSFRKALVVAQFTVTVITAIGVFVVSDQLHFMQHQDLKISLDRILAIEAPKDASDGKFERLNSLKNESMDLAMVENVSSCTTIPGEDYRHEAIFNLLNTEGSHQFYLNDVDANFFPLYDIKFLAGENYNADTPAKNKKGIILNKTAVHALGITNPEDAIGLQVQESESGNIHEIIGVVDNYHQMSLKYQIQAQAFRFNRSRGNICVKINAGSYTSFDDLQNCISSLKKLWNKTYPDQSFEYHFLDAKFNDQYHDDLNFRKVFSFFTVLSLVIACLGLFGLSIFISIKRKKEVGIRKVFGASSLLILVLFTKDYVKQMLVSVLLGIPLAYFIMKAWLEGFSFKTSLHAGSFLIPCLLLIIVSIATTAYQTVRAAAANPTKTLKEE